jgi:hypothetical protein
MLSLNPFTPGINEQAPRTIKFTLTPGLGRAVKAFNNPLVHQGVHFGEKARGSARAGRGGLGFDGLHQQSMESGGGGDDGFKSAVGIWPRQRASKKSRASSPYSGRAVRMAKSS